ncbi:uncharacterized protein LOC132633551 isoform X2 [Lycium barbarum]|uniref:uncharacterized protein LOC132633551 isoform X2 n=1 Tax=Lycium barbarum TaxID=112863 RepID=UPI00293EE127|nr:uncharacterized protein LOC132633551 isoform X2 [Lycium barbarum]
MQVWHQLSRIHGWDFDYRYWNMWFFRNKCLASVFVVGRMPGVPRSLTIEVKIWKFQSLGSIMRSSAPSGSFWCLHCNLDIIRASTKSGHWVLQRCVLERPCLSICVEVSVQSFMRVKIFNSVFLA